MTRRRLPIGIQTCRELRERNCYYVDKTPYIRRLLDGGKHYFLSRPRRFGKSLLLDTLKELFEGSEELFAGLYIHQRHAWSERYPVVRLSFGGGNFRQPDLLEPRVMEQLAAAERRLGVVSEYLTAAGRFAYLLEALFQRRVASISLDEMIGTEDLLSEFDVHHIGTEALLFQTGYLTILSEQDLDGELVYRLGYPNREVRQSLNRSLLG